MTQLIVYYAHNQKNYFSSSNEIMYVNNSVVGLLKHKIGKLIGILHKPKQLIYYEKMLLIRILLIYFIFFAINMSSYMISHLYIFKC